jgi:hypothetical protein
MGKWDSCQRSRGPFYILCVDIAIILFSIVENCRHPIPTGTSNWTFGAGLGKIMSIFVMQVIALLYVQLQLTIKQNTSCLPGYFIVPDRCFPSLYQHPSDHYQTILSTSTKQASTQEMAIQRRTALVAEADWPRKISSIASAR